MLILLAAALFVTLSGAQQGQNMQVRWQLPNQQQQQPNSYSNQYNNYNNQNYHQAQQQRPNYGGGGPSGTSGPPGFNGPPQGFNGPPGDFMPPPGTCKEQQKLRNCMEKMSQVPGVQPPSRNQQQQNTLPMDRTSFEAGCKAYEIFNQCLEDNNLRSICSEDPFIRQLDGSTGYMCREPERSELVNALPCLKQLESDPTIRRCTEDQPRTPPQNPQEQCKLVQKGLNCGKEVYMRCGDRVFNIMVTVTENSMRILDPGCRLERANGSFQDAEAFRSSADALKFSSGISFILFFAFFFKFIL